MYSWCSTYLLDKQLEKDWDWAYGNDQVQGFAGVAVATGEGIYVWGVLTEEDSGVGQASNSIIRLTNDGILRPCLQEGY